jgi:hypothetical protein
MWNFVIMSSEYCTVGWGVTVMAVLRHTLLTCHANQILRAGVVSGHQTVGGGRSMFRWRVLAKSYGLCVVLSGTGRRVLNGHIWQITSDSYITQFNWKQIELLCKYVCSVSLHKFAELRKSESNLIRPIGSGSKYFVVSVILKAMRL